MARRHITPFQRSVTDWRTEATKVWKDFLDAWPLEKLEHMTLEEYAIGTDEHTFSWWLECGTLSLCSLGDSSPDKYGIYFSQKTKGYWVDHRLDPDPLVSFERLKRVIVATAQAASTNNWERLKELENEKGPVFSSVVQHKIAILYQPIEAPFLLPVTSYSSMQTIYGKGLPSWAEGEERFMALRAKKPETDYWDAAYAVMTSLLADDADAMPDEEADNAPDATDEMLDLLRFRKAIVLQGAPGTGKTYAVPELVTRLCGATNRGDDRTKVMEAYKKLTAEGRVVFTTFHPSLDYEDFVEGWKPADPVDDDVAAGREFQLEAGIFKRICESAAIGNAAPSASSETLRADACVWKVSLANAQENPLRTDCLKNNRIRIGWDEYGEDPTDEIEAKKSGAKPLNAFINRMAVGDVVVSCRSDTCTDAVGIVTGDYEWLPDDGLGYYRRSRSVRWLWKGEPVSVREEMNGYSFTLSTVYSISRRFSVQKVKDFLKARGVMKTPTTEVPYVLVIDEINRGNIAKIFGELITLLEVDKRAGGADEESATLAYSKERFTVPKNLYVIGTMNTADRSVSLLDYALRRRFAFYTLHPTVLDHPDFETALFRKVSSLFVENPDAEDSVPNRETLSEEFDPADVRIGHSYFLMAKPAVRRMRWRYEVKPLLLEYVRDGVLKPEALARIRAMEEELDL